MHEASLRFGVYGPRGIMDTFFERMEPTIQQFFRSTFLFRMLSTGTQWLVHVTGRRGSLSSEVQERMRPATSFWHASKGLHTGKPRHGDKIQDS